jgi:restriction endonuclease S subunit
MKEQADVIATNYPFGMSTTIEPKSDDWNKYWEVLKQTKNSFIKNSSAQFIIHIYHSLKPNGRTGFISDRGILNNGCDKAASWETKLRKFMFENNNVYKIIYLPQGAFTYTNFQTCIVFMKKGEKTKKCELYEALFKVPKDKTSEIYVVDKPLKIFTFKELKDTNFSIKVEEEKEEIKAGWVKLGDIVEFKKGKPLKVADIIVGEYPIVSAGKELKGYHNEYNRDKNTICISCSGAYAGYITKLDKKIWADDCMTVTIKNSNYNDIYIYYYLKFMQNILIKSESCRGFQKGTGQPHVYASDLNKIQIPDLTKEHQQEIVDFVDKQFETYNINKLGDSSKNIKLFDLLIAKQYDICADALHLIYRKIEADALHLIYRKIEADALHKQFERDKKAIFNMQVNLCETKEYKLGDMVDFDKGTFNTKDIDNSGKYPYYNSGFNNPSGSHSEFTIDKPEYILFVKDGGNKSNPLNENSGMAKPFYVQGKSAVNACVLIMTNANNKKCILQYIYYFLNYNRYKLMVKAKYNSGLGHLSKNDIIELQIKLPSFKDQKKIIEEIEKLKLSDIEVQELAIFKADKLFSEGENEDALNLLHHHLPNINSPEMTRQYLSMITESYIKLLIDASDLKVKEIFKSSFVLLHPSIREGFGLSVIEAATFGVPSILLNYPENLSIEFGIVPELVCNLFSSEFIAEKLQDAYQNHEN